MGTISFFGETVRVRPMLNAIGAQEALEAHGARVLAAGPRGPSMERSQERERLGLARRRNAAERALRPLEHTAWDRWRGANPAARAAGWAVLTDLPPSGYPAAFPSPADVQEQQREDSVTGR